MGILDIVLILILILGAYSGWKYGCFRSIISLAGSILVFVLAFYLKNPLSVILYENLPFRTYGGIFAGITSFNILVYEGLSYIICLIVLSIILKLIIKLTGVVDKIVDLTIIFALPSKIIGAILGALQYYVYIFIVLFVLAQIPYTAKYVNESYMGEGILSKTPLLSTVTNDIYKSVSEVYEISIKAQNDKNINGDYESLNVLMKYDVITSESVQKLVDKGKLKIENVDELIKKYEVKKW